MTDHDRPPGPEGGPIAETIARVCELDATLPRSVVLPQTVGHIEGLQALRTHAPALATALEAAMAERDALKLRMNAYYYGFDETGCREVDLVLSAVACAGKAYHHTDMWSERIDLEPSEVDNIQAAASAAASTIADLRDRLSLFAPLVCQHCECAPLELLYDAARTCEDCLESALTRLSDRPEHAAACISVGMRILCGRRLLDGVAR